MAKRNVLRILVVEDNERAQRRIANTLRARGHEVFVVDTQKAAEKHVREAFDLAIVDLEIPWKDPSLDLPDRVHGQAVMDAAREAGLPYVMLTGAGTDTDDSFDACQRGALKYFLKSKEGIYGKVLEFVEGFAEDVEKVPKSSGKVRLPLLATSYEDCVVALSLDDTAVVSLYLKSAPKKRATAVPPPKVRDNLYHLATAQTQDRIARFESYANPKSRRSAVSTLRKWLKMHFKVDPEPGDENAPLLNLKAASGWHCMITIKDPVDPGDYDEQIDYFREAADHRDFEEDDKKNR